MLVNPRVERDLRSAPDHVARAFFAGLQGLAVDPLRPRPGLDVKPLEGHAGVMRLRIGQWRFLYSVNLEQRVVRVTKASKRPTAYR